MKTARLFVFALATCCALAAQTADHVSPAEAAAHRVSGVSQPNLPLEAMRKRISGSVCLEITIAPSGDVAAVQPISGHPLLIPPAIEAVKQWKYNSFIWGGEARTVRTEVCVDFPPERLPRRANPISVALLALAFGCLILCAWAWKATLARTEPTVTGVRFAIAIAALAGASMSALIYAAFVITWMAYLWTGNRLLVGRVSAVLWLVSAAAIFASAALQPRVVKVVVGMASLLMSCLWFFVAVASAVV